MKYLRLAYMIKTLSCFELGLYPVVRLRTRSHMFFITADTNAIMTQSCDLGLLI